LWGARHRWHPRDSDVPGWDPHSPREGVLHVHFGWTQRRRRDIWEKELYRKWTPDLIHDRLYLYLDDEMRDYYAYFGLMFTSYLLGGVIGSLGNPRVRFDQYNATCFLVWVGILNRVAVLHAFGFINSVCHKLGTRPFKTSGADTSVNNALVSILIFGEGWHNNHHAHPRSARQGLRWYQWDPAWYGIWLLKALGLAEKVYVPGPEALRKSSISGNKSSSLAIGRQVQGSRQGELGRARGTVMSELSAANCQSRRKDV